MTTDQPSILGVMAGFLAGLPKPISRELRVAEPVWLFLRETYAKAIKPELATTMMGLPIVIDDDLTGGQWQHREGGEVTSSGDMAPAPEGMTVMYSPITGWIAIRSDLMEQAVTVNYWVAR